MPLELPLHRPHGHYTAVVGQALYVNERIGKPDLAEIDKLAGCQGPDDMVNDVDAYCVMLNNGLTILEHTSLQIELLAARGVDYLKEHYNPWSPECEAYFTPQMVAYLQHQARQFIETVQQLPHGSYSRTHRPFVMMDLLAALGRRYSVCLNTERTPGQVRPVLIVPGQKEGVVGWVYEPSATEATLSALRVNIFWKTARPDRGVALIK